MSNHEYRMQKAVIKAVRDPQWGLWKNAWRKTILDWLATEAANRIDVVTTEVSNDWEQFDDHRFLSSLVPNTEEIQDICVTNVLAVEVNSTGTRSGCIATGGNAKEIINGFINYAGFSKRDGSQLRGILKNVSAELIPDQLSQAEFRSILTSDLWTAVGHKLAANVYKNNKAGPYQPDWLILNQLLLAEWLFGCQFSKAAHVKAAFVTMRKSVLGIRGQLFRIPTHVSANGIDDIPPAKVSSTDENLESSRDLLISRVIKDTAAAIRAGDGPFFAFLRKENSSVYMRNCAALYEYSLLSYLTILSIEQLARGYAASVGVAHMKKPGVPKDVTAFIDDPGLSALSETTRQAVKKLFDQRQGNVRHRIMHGMFLDTEAKWDETAAAATGHVAIDVWWNDPLSPVNIFFTSFNCLQQIDADLHRHGALASLDFSWKSEFLPDSNEMIFALRLSSDLTKEAHHGQLWSDDSWVERLDRYAKRFMPCMQHFATAAILGWYRPMGISSLVQFCGFLLIFESSLRLTVHMLGFDVLQKSRRSGQGQLKFQGRMVDANGICTPEIKVAIVEHLPEDQRADAMRCLEIAVKTRNAFAHGAVLSLSDAEKDAMGNALYRAMQTLITCGTHHMIKEAAYFEWLKRMGSFDGDTVSDWEKAREQIERTFLGKSMLSTGS